jgi:uncharacterized damage-inducible protein DinB
METKKWFDRKFDLNLATDDYAAVYKRLQQVPGTLIEIITGVSDDTLAYKPGEKWSIKEHVGHLSILERIWRVRLTDIKESKPV